MGDRTGSVWAAKIWKCWSRQKQTNRSSYAFPSAYIALSVIAMVIWSYHRFHFSFQFDYRKRKGFLHSAELTKFFRLNVFLSNVSHSSLEAQEKNGEQAFTRVAKVSSGPDHAFVGLLTSGSDGMLNTKQVLKVVWLHIRLVLWYFLFLILFYSAYLLWLSILFLCFSIFGNLRHLIRSTLSLLIFDLSS